MKSLFLLGVLTVLAVPVVASKEGPVRTPSPLSRIAVTSVDGDRTKSEGPFSPPSPAAVADGPFSPPTPAPSVDDSLNGEGPFSPPSPAS